MKSDSIDVTYRHHPGAVVARLADQLADVYADARDEEPYRANPIWQRDTFLERTRDQATRPGFSIVIASLHEQLVGFAFGQPMAAGRWFDGDSEPPEQVRAASKFAVIELNVRRERRRHGIGHTLLSELLAGRTEEYAILSTLPTTRAHRLYQDWGWRVVSNTLPDTGLPPWDTLALRLSPATGTCPI